MPDPSAHWGTVPVFGTWKNPFTAAPATGKIRFTIPVRVVSITDDLIFPAGATIDALLDSAGHISINMPTVDDPDTIPNNWSIKVDELLDGQTPVSYYIQPRVAMGSGGLDLTTVILPAASTPPASLVRSAPGGVAGLNASGQVIDAAGNVVTGGGVESYLDLTDKPVIPTSPSDIGAQAAGDYATNTALASNATNDRNRANHTGVQAPSTIAGTAVITTDSRLSDARAPLSHSHAAVDITGLDVLFRSADAVIRYTTTQPLRNTITSDLTRRVRWASPLAAPPVIATGYGVAGDVWEVVG